jgi:hypothetical protein
MKDVISSVRPQNTACDEPFGLELTAERLSRVEQGITNVEVLKTSGFYIPCSIFKWAISSF